MDPTKLIIEHPFTIEERFKKADLEKIKIMCLGSTRFAYKEGGVAYRIWCSKLIDKSKGRIRVIFEINVGNVDEIKTNFRMCIGGFKYNIKCNVCVLRNSWGDGLTIPDDMFYKTGFIIDDELYVKVNGTLIFERPLITTLSIPKIIRFNIEESELKARAAIHWSLKCLKVRWSPNYSSEYSLEIYPNGRCKDESGKVFISLQFKATGEANKIEPYFTMSSGNLIEYAYSNFLYGKDDGFNLLNCSTAELFCPSKRFFVNGEMTLEFKGNWIIKKEEPLVQLLGTPIKGFKTGKDFKLIVDGKDIWVHKTLLIEKSQYFATILNLKESTSNQIFLSGFSFKIVDTAVNLLYGISSTLSLPDLIPLLYFSHKYVISDIKIIVEDQLINYISQSNVCQLIHFSKIFHAPKLHQKSIHFLFERKTFLVNDLDLLDNDLRNHFLS